MKNILSRRTFCALSATLLSSCIFSDLPKTIIQENFTSYLIGPGRISIANGKEAYFIKILDMVTGSLSFIETPFLGHSIVKNPLDPNKFVMIAQRPGTKACEVSLKERKILNIFPSIAQGSFYGHGVYTKDGKYFLCTENKDKSENGQGTITIRDGQTFKIIGNIPSFGIGPHDMALVNDGSILVIANGGLEPMPPDHPLNKTYKTATNNKNFTMDSSLVFIELQSNKLMEKFPIPYSDVSLRHLSVNAEGDLIGALKYYGNYKKTEQRDVPIFATYSSGKKLEFIFEPLQLKNKTKDLSFGLAINKRTSTMGVTHPEGGMVTFWNLTTKEFLKSYRVMDVQGMILSKDQKYFIVNGLNGALHAFRVEDLEPAILHEKSFLDGPNWQHLNFI